MIALLLIIVSFKNDFLLEILSFLLVKELRLDGTYAGNDAIVAFARKFEVNVIIHQLNEAILAVSVII